MRIIVATSSAATARKKRGEHAKLNPFPLQGELDLPAQVFLGGVPRREQLPVLSVDCG